MQKYPLAGSGILKQQPAVGLKGEPERMAAPDVTGTASPGQAAKDTADETVAAGFEKSDQPVGAAVHEFIDGDIAVGSVLESQRTAHYRLVWGRNLRYWGDSGDPETGHNSNRQTDQKRSSNQGAAREFLMMDVRFGHDVLRL